MKKVYKSKVDKLILLIILLPILCTLFFFIIKGDLMPFIVTGLVAAFIANILLSTYYTINGDTFFVESSFFINIKTPIDSIKKITKSDSWEKAPALSMDRIEISYNEKPAVRYSFFDKVIISPENKHEFIENLLQINSRIKVEI
jgi:Bacterial PH domain